MDNWNEQLFDMIGRMRQHSGSRAAAVAVVTSQMMVSDNPDRIKSKAASVNQSVNKVKIIADFLNNKLY